MIKRTFQIKINKSLQVITGITLLVCFGFYCSTNEKTALASTQVFKNLEDTVAYVGMETCKQCHADIYQTYTETGMGSSFDLATKKKSAGEFSKAHLVYDADLDFYYQPFWKGDSLWLMEFRLSGKDTVYKRIEQLNYIIGSGHHTNSHLINRNGYLHQAPITFYTQDQKWDLPPGFEQGFNSRFSRLIGLECMSCHNAYPDFVSGSVNRFNKVPKGIDCERCHGPGAVHVAEKQQGIIVDTSKFIDYSIVNPGKLSIELQFEICQRCHLQGNTIVQPGKSFYDFKPGMKLHDVMSVFLPRYEGDDEHFIMASHADRFKMSKCFIESSKKVDENALRPYKNALTCVTCHNPHVSVKKTDEQHFNSTCRNCHDGTAEQKPLCNAVHKGEKINATSDCVSCHMPVSGSIDIPHVTVHDHYIRKFAVNDTLSAKNTKFLGLQSINNPKPDDLTIAKAYLQQFEKFESGKNQLLDSAKLYIQKANSVSSLSAFRTKIHYHFIKQEFKELIATQQKILINYPLFFAHPKIDFNNEDAWTSYRIAEAYFQIGSIEEAIFFYQSAFSLAPFYPDFQNKLGAAVIFKGDLKQAKQIFSRLIDQVPNYAPALSNLGYISMLNNENDRALAYLNQALQIDPDYEQALLNKAGVLIALSKNEEAIILLQIMKKKFPTNQKIAQALEMLSS